MLLPAMPWNYRPLDCTTPLDGATKQIAPSMALLPKDGWYTSYWNAVFLFCILGKLKLNVGIVPCGGLAFGSWGPRGSCLRPRPVKISHKKDGRIFMFLATPSPLGCWIRYCVITEYIFRGRSKMSPGRTYRMSGTQTTNTFFLTKKQQIPVIAL